VYVIVFAIFSLEFVGLGICYKILEKKYGSILRFSSFCIFNF
jgi:hypothetical protein